MRNFFMSEPEIDEEDVDITNSDDIDESEDIIDEDDIDD